MKRALLSICAAGLVAGCGTLHEAHHAQAPGGREMKMAFDFTDAAPLPLYKKLEVVELTRKQLVAQGYKPMIVVAFRGNASFYTQDSLAAIKEADRAEALKVRAYIRELAKAPGVVAIEQCNVPLEERKLNPKALMTEVKLVANGWISLAEYQQKGYAYIAP